MLLRWGAVALCIPLGAGMAFLTLESVETVLMPVVIVLFLLVLIRPLRFPETVVAFGAGFTALVTYFLFATSGVLTGEATPAGTILFLGSLGAGLAIVVVGVVMLARRGLGARLPD